MSGQGSNTFEQVIAGLDPSVQDLARATRALILELYPETVEVPWPRLPIVGFSKGGQKMNEQFACITRQPDHVDLGINVQHRPPDPEHILEGNAILFRHARLRSLSDLQRPGLRKLLEFAIQHTSKPQRV